MVFLVLCVIAAEVDPQVHRNLEQDADENPIVVVRNRCAAIDIVRNIGEQILVQILDRIYFLDRQRRFLNDPQLAPKLAQDLAEGDCNFGESSRRIAWHAAFGVESEDPKVRYNLLWLIHKSSRGHGKYLRLLYFRFAFDSDWELRREALRMIEEEGWNCLLTREIALDMLRRAESDEEYSSARYACRNVLKKGDHGRWIDALLAGIEKDTAEPATRRRMIEDATELRCDSLRLIRAIEPLQSASDPDLRNRVREILRELKSQAGLPPGSTSWFTANNQAE